MELYSPRSVAPDQEYNRKASKVYYNYTLDILNSKGDECAENPVACHHNHITENAEQLFLSLTNGSLPTHARRLPYISVLPYQTF